MTQVGLSQMLFAKHFWKTFLPSCGQNKPFLKCCFQNIFEKLFSLNVAQVNLSQMLFTKHFWKTFLPSHGLSKPFSNVVYKTSLRNFLLFYCRCFVKQFNVLCKHETQVLKIKKTCLLFLGHYWDKLLYCNVCMMNNMFF